MSIRPEQPEPFLRGCVFPAVTDAPYPRADPAGWEYLPADVWSAARLPVGIRLELVGNAQTVRVWYETSRVSLGYRGESAGCAFVAYRAGQKVATVEAVMGEGMAELLMTGRPDLPVTVYLPEGMAPMITGVAGLEDTMVPAALQPRWLAYGDAVTQGWLASAPAMAWPAVAGRKLGLDVCNLGYAGTARGETTSALMLAETPAEVISIAFGLNNWSRVPHTAALMAEEVRCFLSVVRHGHPETPVVVVSPTVRPDAESEPNRVGATLSQLRTAMEDTVRGRIDEGDQNLFLVEGLSVVDPADLEDGIYPGDEGHRRLAAAIGKILVPQLDNLQAAAEKRWAAEGTAQVAVPVPVPVPYAAATFEAVDAIVGAAVDATLDATVDTTLDATFDPAFDATLDATVDTTLDATVDAAVDAIFETTSDATLETTFPEEPLSPESLSAEFVSPVAISDDAVSIDGALADVVSADGVPADGVPAEAVPSDPLTPPAIFDINSIYGFDFSMDSEIADVDLPEFSLADGAQLGNDMPGIALPEMESLNGATLEDALLAFPDLASGVAETNYAVAAIPEAEIPVTAVPAAPAPDIHVSDSQIADTDDVFVSAPAIDVALLDPSVGLPALDGAMSNGSSNGHVVAENSVGDGKGNAAHAAASSAAPSTTVSDDALADGGSVDAGLVESGPVDDAPSADMADMSVDDSLIGGALVDGKTVDGKTVDGKTVDGKTVDGKTVDGKTVD
ncbi:MAG TPA: SGNH/GDSL hydrolase family protein, partial [Acidimicrobiales bacterium]